MNEVASLLSVIEPDVAITEEGDGDGYPNSKSERTTNKSKQILSQFDTALSTLDVTTLETLVTEVG